MKRFVPLFFVFLVGLNGCVLLTNAPSAKEQRLAVQYDDAGIKTAVTSALLRHNPTKANDVDIHCFQGHVYLVGEADAEFRAYALAVVRQTEGVVQAATHWFPSGTAAAADTALQTAVSNKIQALFAHARVEVDVWGGQAVLTGVLPDQQRIQAAVHAARSVSGVTKVVNYLQVE